MIWSSSKAMLLMLGTENNLNDAVKNSLKLNYTGHGKTSVA